MASNKGVLERQKDAEEKHVQRNLGTKKTEPNKPSSGTRGDYQIRAATPAKNRLDFVSTDTPRPRSLKKVDPHPSLITLATSTSQYSPATISTSQYSPATKATSQYSPNATSTSQYSPATRATSQYSPVTISTSQYSPATISTSQYSPASTATAYQNPAGPYYLPPVPGPPPAADQLLTIRGNQVMHTINNHEIYAAGQSGTFSTSNPTSSSIGMAKSTDNWIKDREERFRREQEKRDAWTYDYLQEQFGSQNKTSNPHNPIEFNLGHGLSNENHLSKQAGGPLADYSSEKNRIKGSKGANMYVFCEETLSELLSGGENSAHAMGSLQHHTLPDNQRPELAKSLNKSHLWVTEPHLKDKTSDENEIQKKHSCIPNTNFQKETEEVTEGCQFGATGANDSRDMTLDSKDTKSKRGLDFQESPHQDRSKTHVQISKKSYDPTNKRSFLKRFCRRQRGTQPKLYKAKLNKVFTDVDNRIHKVEFGEKTSPTPEKVVMLVGATGSGKSTMIDAIVNYMFGIKWDDEYRLKLVPDEVEPGQEVDQAVSQTTMITAYTIHHQPWSTVPYTLTIIDTPGFGDTGGIKRDREITEQIGKFFMTRGESGVDHLDVVGFVAQSSIPRLTPTQRYVFDSILSIFGKDIAQNIFMLLTFADGQKPQILSGLKEANMMYKHFYKFNNSALYAGGKNEDDQDEYESDYDEDGHDFDKMFWSMGASNFDKFMIDVGEVQVQSLVLTAEVLKERNMLEIAVNGIHENIKMGLKKLEQLNLEQQLLEHHQSDIDKNRNFTYEFDQAVLIKINNRPGVYSTNCKKCRRTCHKECYMPLGYCEMMNQHWNWKCQVCHPNCFWKWHEKEPFRYKIMTETVTKTSHELKKRYEEATGKQMTAKELIRKCKEEFGEVQHETLILTERARNCMKRINEIALKPNPLSTTDYIDMMIQEEKFMKEPGWQEAVNQLEEIKRCVEITQQLTTEGYDPFAAHRQNFSYPKPLN